MTRVLRIDRTNSTPSPAARADVVVAGNERCSAACPTARRQLRPVTCSVVSALGRLSGLNKTAKDGKQFKRGLHAIGRAVATAAAFGIVWTYLVLGCGFAGVFVGAAAAVEAAAPADPRSPGNERGVAAAPALSGALRTDHSSRAGETDSAVESPRQATASGEASANEFPPLRYRRVYVPADSVDRWPRGAVRYLPVDPEEFERLLAAAESSGENKGVGPRIISAEYRARFADGCLIDGTGRLTIAAPAGRASALSWRGCNLAISRLRWAPDERPATAGLTEGDWCVRVEGDGELAFDWTRTATATNSRAAVFDLRFPSSPSATLVLELPDDLTPVVDRGLVAAGEWIDEGIRQWRIHLGGHRQTLLELRSDAAATEPIPVGGVVTRTNYTATSRGVDVAAAWTLESVPAIGRRMRAAVDPELTITAVRVDGVATEWIAEDDPAGRRITVTLPEGSDTCVVEFVGQAPLPIGDAQRLPRLWPTSVLWRGGTMRLAVSDQWEIDNVQPSDLIPAPATGGAADGWLAEYRCLSPQAAVALAVRPLAPRLSVSGGTAIEVSGTGATARFVGDVTCVRGAAFELPMDVAAGWQIDSVAAIPADLLDDWTVERSAPQRSLIIKLRRPLSGDARLRLMISARRAGSPVGQRLTLRRLTPLRFPRADSPARLLAIRAVEPYQIEWIGSPPRGRGEIRELSAVEREWLSDWSRGTALNEAEAAESMLVVRGRSSGFAAEIDVQATFSAQRIVESCRWRCTPLGGAVESVIVRFPAADAGGWQWSFGGASLRPLSVQPVPREPPGNVEKERPAEHWRIILPRPCDEPFEIVAMRETDRADPMDLWLPGLPEAVRQTGVCRVYSDFAQGLRFENQRLSSLTTETDRPAGNVVLRGAFAFDPAEEMAAVRPALRIWSACPQLRAWVWSARGESIVEADGNARHVVRYLIENEGLSRAQFAPLPPAFAWNRLAACEVLIDDQPAADAVDRDEYGALDVALPPGRRFAAVTLIFHTAGPPLGTVGRFVPPRWECSLPVFHETRQVRLPAGYRSRTDEWSALAEEPPGVLQRFFGPLVRTASDSADAKNGAFSERSAQESAAALALLIGQYDLPPAARQSGAQLDWGTLLGALDNSPWSIALLVDQSALRSEGVTQRTAVVDRPPPSATTSVPPSARSAAGRSESPDAASNEQRGWRRLRQARLAVITDGRRALLTTARRASSLGDSVQPTEQPGLWLISPEALRRAIQRMQDGVSWSLLPAEAWRRKPVDAPDLWPPPPDIDEPTAAVRGECVEVDDARTFAVDYYHHPGLLVLGAAICAGWWLVGSRVFAGRRRAWLTALWCAAATAVIVPAWLAPIGWGSMCGLLAAGITAAFRRGAASRRAGADAPPAAGPLPSTVAPPAAGRAAAVGPTVLLIAGCCLLGQSLDGAETAAPVEYRVFVPVDAEQRPTEGKLQVPEAFYRELHRRAAIREGGAASWLLGDLCYQGELSRDVSRDQFAIDSIRLVGTLQVFASDVRVRLPLRRDQTVLPAEVVLLDGEPVEVRWSESGEVLEFDVAAPGRYRLELEVRPRSTRRGVEMAIPPALSSRLELVVPAGAPEPTVVGALGQTRWQSDPRRLAADLGSTDRLALEWIAPSPAAIDCDQLLWWRTAPGAASIDVRLRLRVVDGRTDQIAIVTDAAVQPRFVSADDGPVMETELVGDDARRLLFRWPQPISGEISLDFTLLPASPPGVLWAPRIDVADARTTRRWLAVSLDPLLRGEAQDAELAELIAPSDFAAHWGGNPSPPSLALRLPANGPWRWRVSPRTAALDADQLHTVVVSEETASVALDARVRPAGTAIFQLSCRTAAEFDPASIDVRQDDRPVEHRVSVGRGKIVLWFDEPINGEIRVRLSGNVALENKRRLPLPALSIDGVASETMSLRLFRHRSVQVNLQPPAAFVSQTDAAAPGEQPPAPNCRLVGLFRIRSSDTAAGLNITANHPVIRGSQWNLIERRPEGWVARYFAVLDVANGVVDELPLEVPEGFAEPRPQENTNGLTVVEAAGPNRRFLIRPADAISGEFTFRLESPVSANGSQQLSVPMVRVQDEPRVRRYVALPKTIDGKAARWQIVGLRRTAADVPDDWRIDRTQFDLFEAVDENARATIILADLRRNEAQVSLADVTMAVQPGGAYWGTAVFDLLPGRQTEYPLRMGLGQELLHLRVNNRPICLTSGPGGEYRLGLGPQSLPQRIELVFRGTHTGGAHPCDGPRLEGLPAARTLCTLYPPTARSNDTQPSADTWEAEFARVRHTAALIERFLAAEPLGSAERADWYRRWASRLAADLRIAQATLVELGMSRSVSEQRAQLRAVEQQQAALAERWGLADEWTRALASAAPPESVDALRGWAADEGRRAIVAPIEQAGRPLPPLPSGPSASGASRWGAMAVLAAIAATMSWSGARRPLAAFADAALWWTKCHPAAAVICFGFLWAIWFRPAALGWLIALIGTVLLFAPLWTQRNGRRAARYTVGAPK